MNPRRIGSATVAAACAIALALGGCTDDTAVSPTRAVPPPASGLMLADSGLSVAEVLAATNPEPIAVRAYLFVAADGSARLCDAIGESFPPQCAGAAIAAIGLPPELVDGLDVEAGRRWSDGPLQLIGTVRAGVFVNDPEALAASRLPPAASRNDKMPRCRRSISTPGGPPPARRC